jgi:hypothetical protein
MQKYQNIIKAQDVDIIFKTATMTITNHQDEQRATAAAATALRQQVTSGFRVDSESQRYTILYLHTIAAHCVM